MKNLIKISVSILVVIAFLGCSTKKKFIEKELLGAEVEEIIKVEQKVIEQKKKDSFAKKENAETKTDHSTNIHIQFDPKKHDSLNVMHTYNGDSLSLKINGNGLVVFDFKKAVSEVKSKVNEIFGSETLYNIDSTINENRSTKAQVEKKKSIKDKETTDFTLGAWVYGIIGFALLVGAIWLFIYLRKPKQILK